MEYLFACECSNEVVRLEKDPDDGSIYLSVYEHNPKTTWRYKIRQIIKIIKTGSPYSDQVVITKETGKKISDFLK
jgi:hypothetical protein